VRLRNGWRIRTDAHFLLIAVRQLLRYADKLRGGATARDPRVGAAIAKFTTPHPHLVDLRDAVEHLDERMYDLWSKPDVMVAGVEYVTPEQP
jgi:hypothetical protein